MAWKRLIAALLLASVSATASFGRGYENKANDNEKKLETAAPSDVDSRKTARIDINTASKDELKSLPGIGEAYAQRIIDNRPYARKDELTRRSVLPKSTFKQIQERVVAKKSEKRPVKSDTTK